MAADRVENGAPVGGVRSLSGVIAHETTHLLVARRIGEWRAFMLPGWKSEGYADYVARESSLRDSDYARLRANGASRPAMFYYEARRRVAEALRRNGGNVEAMLESTMTASWKKAGPAPSRDAGPSLDTQPEGTAETRRPGSVTGAAGLGGAIATAA